MRYGEIKDCDIANGLGVRVSLFVSGCRHHCKGCFNPETWNFDYGQEFTSDTEDQLIKMLDRDYIKGLSLLGGEPFEVENQHALAPFLKKVRQIYPQKDIWCYTGYLFDEQLQKDSAARCDVTDEMLGMIDVLVDGEFILEQKNISLKFRGSENQRVIDVKRSLDEGRVILFLE